MVACGQHTSAGLCVDHGKPDGGIYGSEEASAQVYGSLPRSGTKPERLQGFKAYQEGICADEAPEFICL